MNLCILKSASRDTYLAQNLKLLQMRERDEYALRYRARWIHPSVAAAETLADSPCILVYCDPPEFNVIPVRHARIYNHHMDEHSGVFYLRCGPFCDPKAAQDWSRDFRLSHPNAGMPPDGYFVLPIEGMPLCSEAKEDDQRHAWREIVSDLAKHERYKRCFFLFDNGIEADDGSLESPENLQVGTNYTWRVLSYNKHLKQQDLESVKPIVIADEAVLRAHLKSSRGLRAYGDIEVALEPCAAGESRLELCLSGVTDSTARIKLEVECIAPVHLPRTEPRETTAGDSFIAAKLRVFSALSKVLEDQNDLYLRVLLESFDAEERTHFRVAEQLFRSWFATGDLEACMELASHMTDEQLERLSDYTKRCLIIAHSVARKRLPDARPLREFPLFEEEHWTEFRRHVLGMPPSSAAELVSSLMREGHQALVDETDVAELLTQQTVSSGFTTPERIKSAAAWLRNNAEASLAFSFLANRIGELNLGDLDILQEAVDFGERCQASDLARVVERLLSQLLNRREGQRVMELVRSYQGLIDPELACELLYRGAICTEDTHERAKGLLKAADVALEAGDRERAAMILDRLRGHLSAVPDQQVEDALASRVERLEILSESESLRTPYQEALRLAHECLVGRAIALLGGQFEPEWIQDLENDLGCKIDWYQSTRSQRIDRNSPLIEGIENGKYRAVIQLRWVSHSDELRRACTKCNIPLRFSYGSGKQSIVRLLAQSLRGEIRNT